MRKTRCLFCSYCSLLLAITFLSGAAFAQERREETVVARFVRAQRGAVNGKPHLMVVAEAAGGQTVQVAVPNADEGRAYFDPSRGMADAIEELKQGDLVQLTLEPSRNGPRNLVLRSVKPYELKPGEDTPNGYVFKGSDEKDYGSRKVTIVQLEKLGQKLTVAIPEKKAEKGTSKPDPELLSAVNELKEGDPVWAELSGKTLVAIEPYTEPQQGKLLKFSEIEVDGHKVRSAEIDEDGKSVTALVPGKASGRAWTPDLTVMRQLARVRPGSMIQFRAKEDGDKIWLRSIEPASKPKPESETRASKKK
jgi:hypothetical protein